MNIEQISELKENLLDCTKAYPVIQTNGSKDSDVNRIIRVIGGWYGYEVRRKLPVNLHDL